MVYTITFTPNKKFLRTSEIFSGQVKPPGYLPSGQVKLSLGKWKPHGTCPQGKCLKKLMSRPGVCFSEINVSGATMKVVFNLLNTFRAEVDNFAIAWIKISMDRQAVRTSHWRCGVAHSPTGAFYFGRCDVRDVTIRHGYMKTAMLNEEALSGHNGRYFLRDQVSTFEDSCNHLTRLQ